MSDALDVFSYRARLLPWADRGLRRGLRSWDPDLYPRLDDITTDQLPGAEMLILHDLGPTGGLADLGMIRLVTERLTDVAAKSGGDTGPQRDLDRSLSTTHGAGS